MVESADIRVLASELVKRMNEDSRRIRVMEQRADRIEMSLSSLEDNVSDQMGEIKSNIDKLSVDIKTISDKLIVLESEISKIVKDLGKKATRSDVKELESYISLMNPITSTFVTKEEMEKKIEEKNVR